jgi:hypothetical protein
MTPAERQARRRALQSQERAIREASKIGDDHGKSRAETESGGYDAAKLDVMYARGVDSYEDGEELARSWRRVAARESNTLHGPGGEELRGVEVGTEESNRRRFAENMLEELAREQFESPDTANAPSSVQHYVGNAASSQGPPAIPHTCKLCGDVMHHIEDAKDHLRVDHKEIIKDFFKARTPHLYFRDMVSHITVAARRKR